MTQEDIIRMAREAGLPKPPENSHDWANITGMWLQRFAALVAAAEREECAKFFDDNDTNMFWGSQAASHIRAMGQA